MAFSTFRGMMAAGTNATPPVFTVKAANFNGTNSSALYSSTLTGVSDSSTGIFSCWINLAGSSNMEILTNAGVGSLQIDYIGGSGKLEVFLSNTSGTNSLDIITNSTYNSGSGWLNILASWNTNFGAGSKIANLYINGVSSNTITDTNAAFNVDYTTSVTGWGIGYFPPSSTFFNGCISELYFAPGQFLDFTNSTNRAKFYNAGNPVNLGSDGSIPTGTAPAVYWKGIFNDGTNQGTGGGPFVLTSLTNCGTTP